ncbi:MAG TPA: hypothetical protein VFR05_08790 [Terriglobia bacterium]|nr:hypothetical protein [Terriglobia bacterium]
MRVLQPVLCLALLVLTAASLTAQLSIESPPVVLPNGGTLDERPFFATRRHPAVDYDHQATDPVAQLARGVEEGSRGLRFEGRSGYLLAVLEALGVPKESQALVFSKTSLQAHYISPTNPRAIYFSDNISVAYVRDAPLLEIAALDPRQGVVFYALEQRPQERPKIVRADSCLSCHESRNTMDVPGLLVRSMAVGIGGQTMPQFGNYVSDHRSPFNERWGGWYITGMPGTARHMGNEMLEPDGSGRLQAVPKPYSSVAGWFDLDGYPSDSSDVVAAMVLQHQARMTNLLTRVGWESRIAVSQQQKNPQEKQAAQRLITANARELVDYMLFVEEAPFPGKIVSLADFQKKFPASGPRDRRGRSLRQLDLQKRLMRFPCSYMIYSGAFDELPGAAKDAVYARLWEVLSGQEKSARYSRLSTTDRAAIVTILLETKSDLPAYYRRLER